MNLVTIKIDAMKVSFNMKKPSAYTIFDENIALDLNFPNTVTTFGIAYIRKI